MKQRLPSMTRHQVWPLASTFKTWKGEEWMKWVLFLEMKRGNPRSFHFRLREGLVSTTMRMGNSSKIRSMTLRANPMQLARLLPVRRGQLGVSVVAVVVAVVAGSGSLWLKTRRRPLWPREQGSGAPRKARMFPRRPSCFTTSNPTSGRVVAVGGVPVLAGNHLRRRLFRLHLLLEEEVRRFLGLGVALSTTLTTHLAGVALGWQSWRWRQKRRWPESSPPHAPPSSSRALELVVLVVLVAGLLLLLLLLLLLI
jgi:hypothetical protein